MPGGASVVSSEMPMLPYAVVVVTVVGCVMFCIVACVLACRMGCVLGCRMGCVLACRMACVLGCMVGCVLGCMVGCVVSSKTLVVSVGSVVKIVFGVALSAWSFCVVEVV